jgi:hypothetical protein
MQSIRCSETFAHTVIYQTMPPDTLEDNSERQGVYCELESTSSTLLYIYVVIRVLSLFEIQLFLSEARFSKLYNWSRLNTSRQYSSLMLKITTKGMTFSKGQVQGAPF